MRFQVLFVLSTPMGPAVVCRDVLSRSPGGFGWSNWTICHVTSKNTGFFGFFSVFSNLFELGDICQAKFFFIFSAIVWGSV